MKNKPATHHGHPEASGRESRAPWPGLLRAPTEPRTPRTTPPSPPPHCHGQPSSLPLPPTLEVVRRPTGLEGYVTAVRTAESSSMW